MPEAAAINWDGHDDWMADMPQAREFERERPDLRRPPAPRDQDGCVPRADAGKVPENPYEQVKPPCGEAKPR